jgi:hypothetical protein
MIMVFDELEKAGMRTIAYDIHKLKAERRACVPPSLILRRLLDGEYNFDFSEFFNGQKEENNGL